MATDTTATTDSITLNRQRMLAECGRVVLWFGVDTRNWTLAQHAEAARNCRAWGIDSACVKVADGTIHWYDEATTKALRQVYLDAGVGFIPFTYCYGNTISNVAGEAQIVKDLWAWGMPVVQIDCEAEYNGHPEWAAQFAGLVKDTPGLLSQSTWADPNEQNWDAVLAAFAPVCNAQTPQEYTNWLAGAEQREWNTAIYTCIQPGIDLTHEFGANDQATIVRAALNHGAETIYLWYYDAALANQDLVRQLVGMVDASVAKPAPPAPPSAPTPTPEPPTPPEPTPAPSPAAPQAYTVVSGDSLFLIAERFYHNGDDWPTIYHANQAMIGSDPNMLHIGLRLTIPAQA